MFCVSRNAYKMIIFAHSKCKRYENRKIQGVALPKKERNGQEWKSSHHGTHHGEQDKKKGGRPPTGRVRKLSKSVTVKFSKPSYEALRLRARKANRKLAEYIRESALNGEVVSGHNTETVAIAKNLIGMANNLNQLTKLSHQRGFHETHVYVVDLLRRLKAILGEYRQASYKPKPSSMGRKEDTT